MPENGTDVIIRYLEDAIAAEQNFEDQCAAIAKMGEQGYVTDLFHEYVHGARSQHEQLTERLKELGGSPSKAKSWLAHFLAFGPMAAQAGQHGQEKNTQHLIMVIAAASAEMAMYEALATVASTVGDTQTEILAQKMLEQERRDREKAWALLERSAADAFQSATEERTRGAA